MMGVMHADAGAVLIVTAHTPRPATHTPGCISSSDVAYTGHADLLVDVIDEFRVIAAGHSDGPGDTPAPSVR